MLKLRVLAVATALGILATTAASATALESHFPTWDGSHSDFSISRDGVLPPTAGGLDATQHGFWPPTENPTY